MFRQKFLPEFQFLLVDQQRKSHWKAAPGRKSIRASWKEKLGGFAEKYTFLNGIKAQTYMKFRIFTKGNTTYITNCIWTTEHWSTNSDFRSDFKNRWSIFEYSTWFQTVKGTVATLRTMHCGKQKRLSKFSDSLFRKNNSEIDYWRINFLVIWFEPFWSEIFTK